MRSLVLIVACMLSSCGVETVVDGQPKVAPSIATQPATALVDGTYEQTSSNCSEGSVAPELVNQLKISKHVLELNDQKLILRSTRKSSSCERISETEVQYITSDRLSLKGQKVTCSATCGKGDRCREKWSPDLVATREYRYDGQELLIYSAFQAGCVKRGARHFEVFKKL